MSSYDESMEDFVVLSDSGSDFEASPKPAKGKAAAKAPAAKAPAKARAAAKSSTAIAAEAKAAAAAAGKPKKAAGGASTAAAAKAKKPAAAASKPKKKAAAAVESDNDSDRENNNDEGVMDLDSEGGGEDSDAAGSSKAAPSRKAPAAKKATTTSTKDASEMYQKVTQVEHVLKRPDTYIGSIEAQTQSMWVYDNATKGMVFRNVTFVPGLYKIFDEILVNAADNKRNDDTMDIIKVVIDREAGLISCYNNGRGIPVQVHAKEKIYIPELIFGNLLTSSNYDDNEKKVTGGRNGYGAKLANIYSTEFTVETADKTNGKKYKQVFKDNMSVKGAPKITDNKKGEEWTKITFKPDFERFGMPDGIDDDTESLLKKRVYDLAGCVAGVKVELNGEKIKIKNFKAYVEMYTNAVNEIASGKKAGKGAAARGRAGSASRAGSEQPAPLVGASPGGTVAADGTPKVPIVYEKFGERWEVAFAPSEGQFQQVSFVNSIATTKGGTHVEYITKQLVDGIIESISKKAKKQVTTIKPFTVKNHLWVFVNCLVENPAFDSQTKENMTLQAKKFGSKCTIGDAFLKKVINSGVIDSVLSFAQYKQDQLMKKSDGTKRSRMLGIAALDDANHAGTKNAKNCTLILTEGLSAKTFAVSGLAVVGRDTYGVFPLRGKLLNVRDAAGKTLTENQEITHLKQILGLQHGKAYTSVDSLRYGRLMVMTDQDHDGSHIKGLIINFLDHFFPGLLQIPGFLVEFITPIVKVTKGKKSMAFFTIPEYEGWKQTSDDGRGWHIKYYKGLGTSTAAEAKTYFSDLKKHMLKFGACGKEDRALVDMAFNKKKADERKEWLRGFVPGTFLDHNIKEIPIKDFINKELILFSMADNMRSIPSVVDGFKPGQRKVIFGCFKRKLKGEIKVAQLVGYISEAAAYHHGEASLAGTIVGLAQHFVGNNNINVLSPNGQFGTRLQGGKDHASARYIFTSIAPLTRLLFHKEDDAILTYLNDDGQSIEPTWYMPILPMVLVNGSDGIGTGWSSAVPNYNPLDIIANLRRRMKGEPMEPMHPWFRAFKGEIEANGVGRYTSHGIAAQTDAETVEIFELPIRSWTNAYVEQLLAWSQTTEKQPALVKEFVSQSTDTSVHLIVTLTSEGKTAIKKEGLEKALKLTSSVATTNMVCFDQHGKIKKYTSPEEIIDDFYDLRLTYYMKRKNHLVAELTYEYDRLSNQARFITMFIAGQLKIMKREHEDIVHDLRKLDFKPFPKKARAIVASDPDASGINPADLDEINEDSGANSDYDYLLEMSISSLTAAKARKLLAARDMKQEELNTVLAVTPKVMWMEDLAEFEKEWLAVLDAEAHAPKEKTVANASKAGKGKGKAVEKKGNSIQEAFAKQEALKLAAGADIASSPSAVKKAASKSAAPAAAKGKAKAAATTKAKTASPAAKPKRKTFIYEDLSESEAEMTLHDDDSVEQSSAATDSDVSEVQIKASTRRRAVLDEDESDADMAPAAKGKAKAIKEDTDDDDEEEFAKPIPPAKRKTASKVVDLESSSDVPVDDSDEDDFIVRPAKKRK